MVHQQAGNLTEALATLRLLPVLVLPRAGGARAVGEALVDGGLPIAEVTFRTDAAEDSIQTLASVDGLLVGAGTVTTAEQVDRASAAGARFIVSPGMSTAVVHRCAELGLPALPGVATATDITLALAQGLDVVKFFPAKAMGGLTTISALAAPFPAVRFVPTGGITAESATAYLAHPSVLAVGGSWMVPSGLIAAEDWQAIRALAQRAVTTVSPLHATERAGDGYPR